MEAPPCPLSPVPGQTLPSDKVTICERGGDSAASTSVVTSPSPQVFHPRLASPGPVPPQELCWVTGQGSGFYPRPDQAGGWGGWLLAFPHREGRTEFCASCPEEFLALGPVLASCQAGEAQGFWRKAEGTTTEVGFGAFLPAFGFLCLINEISQGKGARITPHFLSEQVSPVHGSKKKGTFLLAGIFRHEKFGVFSSCLRTKHIFWD